jgi:ABC-type dipeptide/oligopeptide/nickel transport system permease component
MRKLFQICVMTLVVLFSLPFFLLAILLFIVLFNNRSTETSGVATVTGGVSLPAWFFLILAFPVLSAGLYLITRWARHRR